MKEWGSTIKTTKPPAKPIPCGSVFSYYCDCMRHKWPALVINPNGDKHIGIISGIVAEGGDYCWIVTLNVEGEKEQRKIFVRAY